MKILIVAGNYDELGGRSSGLIPKLFGSKLEDKDLTIFNGGHYDTLPLILEAAKSNDVVFWFANVDNTLPKIRNVKEINPKCLLVSSKRNDNDKYCFEELINHALGLKANLTFEFSKQEDLYAIRVYDPLGVVWCDRTLNYEEVLDKTFNRLEALCQFTREGTIMSDKKLDCYIEDAFLKIIKEKAEIFHQLIQPPETVDRFLGNASFRCVHGFPSFRGNNCIVVSRRNVDKTGINKQDFVPVIFKNNTVFAYSNNKPSVDTPVQVRLYEQYKEIKYMIHSHVYIQGACFTEEAIPCGAIEEVEDIKKTIVKNNIDTTKSFSINLLGHGSIIFAKDLDYFERIEFIKRPIPEIL